MLNSFISWWLVGWKTGRSDLLLCFYGLIKTAGGAVCSLWGTVCVCVRAPACAHLNWWGGVKNSSTLISLVKWDQAIWKMPTSSCRKTRTTTCVLFKHISVNWCLMCNHITYIHSSCCLHSHQKKVNLPFDVGFCHYVAIRGYFGCIHCQWETSCIFNQEQKDSLKVPSMVNCSVPVLILDCFLCCRFIVSVQFSSYPALTKLCDVFLKKTRGIKPCVCTLNHLWANLFILTLRNGSRKDRKKRKML